MYKLNLRESNGQRCAHITKFLYNKTGYKVVIVMFFEMWISKHLTILQALCPKHFPNKPKSSPGASYSPVDEVVVFPAVTQLQDKLLPEVGNSPQSAIAVVHHTHTQCQPVGQTVTGGGLQLEIQVLQKAGRPMGKQSGYVLHCHTEKTLWF